MTKRPSIEVWMPLHFADITKACGRMSELEECAFLRILRDQWLNGAPPNDDATLARIVRYAPAKWRRVRPALEPHFDLSNGLWSHTATEARRQHAISVSQTKREAANARHGDDDDGCKSDAHDDAYAAIRDLSSSSSNSVGTNLNQDISTEVQDSSQGNVIPLVVGASRA